MVSDEHSLLFRLGGRGSCVARSGVAHQLKGASARLHRPIRERARRLRQMADAHHTPLSGQLRVMATELDALADRAEKGNEPGENAE
jgi:hypothetical protein